MTKEDIEELDSPYAHLVRDAADALKSLQARLSEAERETLDLRGDLLRLRAAYEQERRFCDGWTQRAEAASPATPHDTGTGT